MFDIVVLHIKIKNGYYFSINLIFIILSVINYQTC